MVGSDHVNIYMILKNILLEQNKTENLITSISVGKNFREAPRQSYRLLYEKINFVLGSYSPQMNKNFTEFRVAKNANASLRKETYSIPPNKKITSLPIVCLLYI
ncbi:hypothetical protein HZS_5108 [Henneguya salminicola]|nr:hypothetical protein HZS_5108 [Henneguya salminicola]